MKSFRSHDELVALLQQRGMDVDDPIRARATLRRHGYHRLGGYRYPFRRPLPPERVDVDARSFRSDDYQSGTRLDDVIQLVEFDARLRQVCLVGLFEFEVRLRAAIAHALAARDPLAHRDVMHLDGAVCASSAKGGTKFEAWMATADNAERRGRDEDYCVHHRARSSDPQLPVWALVELLDFGSLPYLFDLLKVDDRRAVAEAFGIRHPSSFVKWVHSLCDLRNVCAHNQRLFNRSFKRTLVVRTPGIAPDLDHLVASHYYPVGTAAKKLYPVVAVLATALRGHESGSQWPLAFKTQVRKLPSIRLSASARPLITAEDSMGFPSNWETLPMWSGAVTR
ncbi:Abi family protein [Cellulomonas taurus]|uniref:Abi family protein n=1 Tax=Cellulomonas taurus TaxID=2729175 RepID=UPI00145D6821|nr:Abi family protein [Cellulomonas taurus]